MDKEEILAAVRKEYGDESIFTLDNYVRQPVDVISTGSFILDYFVLEVGGFPKGRVTMMSGAEGSGKTTVGLHVAANAQQQGLYAAYIDAEQKLDPGYAANLGVDVSNLFISQPPTLDKGLGVAEALCKHPEIGLIVYDSVPALGSKVEYETDELQNVSADYGKYVVTINMFLRRNIYTIRENGIVLLLTNQLRENISTFMGRGKKTRTPGGRGLKHYSSVLLELTYIGRIEDGDKVIGQKVKAFTSKNNVACAFRTAEFNIYSGLGIDHAGDILLAAADTGVVDYRKPWYVYKDKAIAQGKPKAVQKLKEDPDLLSSITQELKGLWQNE